MTRLRRFLTYTFILGALVLSVSAAMGADDFMVLRFKDGSSQRIKLDGPAHSIRQIEFVEGERTLGREDRAEDRIRVISATYGRNCGAADGNVTDHLAGVCDGKRSCEYVIDVRVLGDPATGCPKDYVAEWQCGRNPDRGMASARPEAGNGTAIVLRCPVR